MERTSSGFYVIDVLPLHQASRRPFHLEERMKRKHKQRMIQQHQGNNHFSSATQTFVSFRPPHSPSSPRSGSASPFSSLTPSSSSSSHDLASAASDLLTAELKRQNILDERRGKLAKKYAHVKHVMRSKQMDHERDEKRKKLVLASNMKTAESKREAILQRQVRQCARAVEKAREVAHRHSKKVTEETARKRMELETRINETSKRREKILSHGGHSKIKGSIEPMDTTEDESQGEGIKVDVPQNRMVAGQAALLIQQWYRHRKFMPLILAFQRDAASLSVQVAKGLQFQDVCALLQSPSVIKSTRDLLTRAFKSRNKPLDHIGSTTDDPRKKSRSSDGIPSAGSGVAKKSVQRTNVDQRYKTPARIFLSAYMIAAHTESILTDVHKEIMEKRLLVTSLSMLQAFEDWVKAMMEERTRGVSLGSLKNSVHDIEDDSVSRSGAKKGDAPTLRTRANSIIPPAYSTKRKSFDKDIPQQPKFHSFTGSSPSYHTFNNFLNAWHTYHHAFTLWKQRDTIKLLKSMTEHFLELDALWDSIRNSSGSDSSAPNGGGSKDHPAVEGEWKPRIMKQRAEIRERVLRIGGVPALERMLTKQREARIRRREEANTDASDNTSDDDGDDLEEKPVARPGTVPLFDVNRNTQKFSDSVHTSSKSFAIASALGQSPDMVPAAAADMNRESAHQDPLIAASLMSSLSVSSPVKESFPSSVPMEHRSTPRDSTISNEALAHEMVMDPDFTLKPRQRTAKQAEEREAQADEYFALVKAHLAKNEVRNWLPALVADVRERLVDLTPENSTIRRQVQEGLDTELIHQQIQRRSLDLTKLLTFFTDTMQKLCAPVRDTAIRNLSIDVNPTLAPEVRIRRILDMLESMRLDLANYRLQSIRPQLKLLAVDYESSKFNEALVTGKFTLKNTTAWLTEAASVLRKLKMDRDPEGIRHPDATVRYEHVYTEALLGLLIAYPSGVSAPRSPPTSSTSSSADSSPSRTLTPAQLNLQARHERYSIQQLPESLLLDRDRIITYSNEAHVLTLVAALVTMSRNLHTELRSLDSPTSKSLRSALLVLLHDDLTVSVESLTIQVISVLENSSSTPTRVPEETRQLMHSLVEKLLGGRDPVYTLIARRLATALRHFMLNSGTMMSPAGLARAGLSPVETELHALARKIYALARHNREVHAKWYDEIIRRLLE